MLNKNVAELLNTQVNKEFYSAYLYLDFANFYEAKGLNGFHLPQWGRCPLLPLHHTHRKYCLRFLQWK